MRIRRVFCVSGCALLAFLTASCTDIEDSASARVEIDAPTTTSPAIDWQAVKLLYEVRTWNGTVTFWNVARWHDTVRENAETAGPKRDGSGQGFDSSRRGFAPQSDTPAVSAPSGLGPCGGDLPPCYVVQRESGGSYTAFNPSGCGGYSCGGKYQFDPRTWGGYGGYQQAQDAPPEVQDARARELWAGGEGCSHWAAC